MVELGAGMLLFEPPRLAVFESLLPNGSSQLGPPLCIKTPTGFLLAKKWVNKWHKVPRI
jgi:hypothetical protein